MSLFRPMLAGKAPEDLETLRYPVLVSPKLDGIRAVIRDGVALSRSLKPIPNNFVQSELKGLPNGLDGELMVAGGFNDVQSGIMSRDGEPDFHFCAFDCVPGDGLKGYLTCDGSMDFEDRFKLVCCVTHPRVQVVQHEWATDPTGIDMIEARYLAAGHEGLMIRDPNGPYKFGRSTMKEGWLLKLKRFEDAEAIVIGAVERFHNENELEKDNLGHAKRSHMLEGMVPAGDLGALVCRTPAGVEFEIGSGFTAQQRIDLWRSHKAGSYGGLRDTIVCYKFQPHGTLERPRCPVFKGFRSKDDL